MSPVTMTLASQPPMSSGEQQF